MEGVLCYGVVQGAVVCDVELLLKDAADLEQVRYLGGQHGWKVYCVMV